MISTESRLGKREATMTAALALLADGANIVETGCARTSGSFDGDGLSTVIFGEWALEHRGHVTTVDISALSLAACRAMTRDMGITYVQSDSVAFLQSFADPIDLLYLDSLDYPMDVLLRAYGGETDLDGALHDLDLLTEADVVSRFPIVLLPQEHCRAELTAALPNLHSRSVVLIDDAGLPGGGKARLAKDVLSAAGWRCVADRYQTLWVP